MTGPPSRYIRGILSKPIGLNLSRLPKLPKGTPPLIVRLSFSHTLKANQAWQSKRATPGDFEPSNSSWGRKTVDDDFSKAVRREASAGGELEKSEKRLSQKATRFPSVRLPSVGIRMMPKKMLSAKEHVQPPILSKNPRKEVLVWLVSTNSVSLILYQRSDFSLVMIIPKATVHRFAVVRVRIKRRIVGALDLIIRRGVFPFPKSKPDQSNKSWKPRVEDRKPDPKGPRILLYDQTLADPQAWILPGMHP